MFNVNELKLIDWMLDTATENNPTDAELEALQAKVQTLIGAA